MSGRNARGGRDDRRRGGLAVGRFEFLLRTRRGRLGNSKKYIDQAACDIWGKREICAVKTGTTNRASNMPSMTLYEAHKRPSESKTKHVYISEVVTYGLFVLKQISPNDTSI